MDLLNRPYSPPHFLIVICLDLSFTFFFCSLYLYFNCQSFILFCLHPILLFLLARKFVCVTIAYALLVLRMPVSSPPF
jgi:hypothetical protein